MTMAGMAEVLAAHQKYGMGMSGDSPDTCKCRAKIYPAANDGYIEDRRDNAFADHVADELTKAGYGSLQETKAAVWDEAYWTGVQDQMDAADHSSDDFGIPGGFPVRPARVNPYQQEAA